MLLTAVALRIVAVAALLMPAAWWLVSPRVDPLLQLPTRVGVIEQQLQTLQLTVSAGRLDVVLFQGMGISTREQVERNSFLEVTYVLRRTIDCPTSVLVRFWSHDKNALAYVADSPTPAVRAPVTTSFNPFTLTVRVPEALPPGRYSYFPELTPVNCGAYGSFLPPMSTPFEVL